MRERWISSIFLNHSFLKVGFQDSIIYKNEFCYPVVLDEVETGEKVEEEVRDESMDRVKEGGDFMMKEGEK